MRARTVLPLQVLQALAVVVVIRAQMVVVLAHLLGGEKKRRKIKKEKRKEKKKVDASALTIFWALGKHLISFSFNLGVLLVADFAQKDFGHVSALRRDGSVAGSLASVAYEHQKKKKEERERG